MPRKAARVLDLDRIITNLAVQKTNLSKQLGKLNVNSIQLMLFVIIVPEIMQVPIAKWGTSLLNQVCNKQVM